MPVVNITQYCNQSHFTTNCSTKRQLKAAYLMNRELYESCPVWSESTTIYRPVVLHATVRHGHKVRYKQLQQWGNTTAGNNFTRNLRGHTISASIDVSG